MTILEINNLGINNEKDIKLLNRTIPYIIILGNGNYITKPADVSKIFKCIKEDTNADNKSILDFLYWLIVGIETVDENMFQKAKFILKKNIYDDNKRTNYKYYKYVWNFYNTRFFYAKIKERQFSLDFFN